MNFIEEAAALQDTLLKYRRYFHQYPEVSRQEFNTAGKIVEILSGLGLEVQSQVAHPLPGVVALLRGGHPGPTVALRADMDALSQTEARDCPYRSRNPGAQHGCGHDAHMAIQLGAARLLAAHQPELRGNVKFIFQPSEEIYGGAEPMIQAGVLENPQVDAIFALHVDSGFKTGEIALSYGETMASSDRLIIRVKGKSAHGAYPHEGNDAIVTAAHLIVALQSLISRCKDTFQPAVLSFGYLEGGRMPNSISDDVLIRGILRTLNPTTREFLIQRIQQVVEGIGAGFNSECVFERQKSYDSLINDNGLVDFQKSTAARLFGEDKIRFLPHARMIVEDFAFFAQAVPGAMCFLGTGNPAKDTEYPLHSTNFDIDEEALSIGTALQAALAWDYLQNF